MRLVCRVTVRVESGVVVSGGGQRFSAASFGPGDNGLPPAYYSCYNRAVRRASNIQGDSIAGDMASYLQRFLGTPYPSYQSA